MVKADSGLRSEKGYSMVELMVTMAILAIIATPLAAYFIVGAHNNRLAREQMEAAHLAQLTMEDWKAAPMIGALTTTETAGIFTVVREAEPVERFIDENGDGVLEEDNRIFYADTQPPVVPESPAPAPVAREIENYQYSASDTMSGPADVVISETATPGVYLLSVGGVSQAISDGFSLKVELSLSNQIVFSGTGFSQQTISYTPGVDPVRIVFTMNASANINVNVSTKGPAADVYVFQGFNSAAGSNYPDSITVNPVSSDIRVFENLKLTPSLGLGFNPVRVYQLTVTVTRSGNPLVQLVSYKRIQ